MRAMSEKKNKNILQGKQFRSQILSVGRIYNDLVFYNKINCDLAGGLNG